jgi:hypothetical protein
MLISHLRSLGKTMMLVVFSPKLSAPNSLIMVHISLKNAFLEGAGFTEKVGTGSGDYNGQINSVNFE